MGTTKCVVIVVLLMGCSSESTNEGAGGTGGSGTGGADGAAYYAQKCAVCHGDTGAGDGPGGAALDPKPANFRAPAWQASVTDAYLKQFVVDGGAANGKSAACSANPDLKGDAAMVDALVKYLRGFGP